MPIPQMDDAVLRNTVDVAARARNKCEAAGLLGIARDTLDYRLRAAERRGVAAVPSRLLRTTRSAPQKPTEAIAEAEAVTPPPEPAGRIHALETAARPVPDSGVRRYLFTCAQNDTKLHEPFWENLLAFASEIGAEIHVSRFAYIKPSMGESSDKAGWTRKQAGAAGDDRVWDGRLSPYLSDGRIEVAPGLVWCGEMNILPTARRPLSGLDSYTGRASGVFPHAKIALESVATAAGEQAKMNFTTGAVTQRNYIQRKAGLMAEFHHCYGALLVEVDAAGDWFARQINATSEGDFYDLDAHVAGGRVTRGHRVAAITWGDIHDAERVGWVNSLAFGFGGMLDTLGPSVQFFHDVMHFRGRSHHEIKNPHRMFARHVNGQTDIAAEVREVVEFLDSARRNWCDSVIVDSNHHHHMGRWLQEQDGRNDPLNAMFWLSMQMRVYGSLQAGLSPNYLVEAIKEVAGDQAVRDRFLSEDESFVICRDAGGGIECGMHGDLGPNGSRGSAPNLSRMGRKANIGHSHSAAIFDGIYQAGTHGELRPDWTRGPSSWSHSDIVTYANGKRCIVTSRNGKWRAA